MAGVIKQNPKVAAQQWEQVGKVLTWFTVTDVNIPVYNPSDAEAPTDAERLGYEADGAINALLGVIQLTTTVVAMGPVVTGGIIAFAVEGEFTGQDNFDGTADTGDLKLMNLAIVALGTVIGTASDGTPNGAGVDFTGAVVSTSKFELEAGSVVAIT